MLEGERKTEGSVEEYITDYIKQAYRVSPCCFSLFFRLQRSSFIVLDEKMSMWEWSVQEDLLYGPFDSSYEIGMRIDQRQTEFTHPRAVSSILPSFLLMAV